MSVQTAETALQAGNSCFVDENYEEALKEYTLSIDLEKTAEAFLKRSICHYKLENYTDAIADANEAIKLKPENSKAYLRKGMACFALEEFESAKEAFQRGQKLDPKDSNFKTWIRKCNAELDVEEMEVERAVETATQPQKIEVPPSEPKVESKVESPVEPKVEPKVEKKEISETKTTENAAIKAQPSLVTSGPKIRHEWYQTNTHVIITIFAKNIKKEQTSIEFGNKTFSVTIKLAESNDYQMDLELFDKIIPSECAVNFLSTKIEIKLKKGSSIRWNSLEGVGEPHVSALPTSSTTSGSPAPKKNWDKIVNEVASAEPLDSEDPLAKVFKEIYSNGTPEQQRAMMKSFMESSGTVLSTNWDEVGKAPVKCTPPNGMEAKTWNEE